MKQKLWLLLIFMMVFLIALTGCGTPAETPKNETTGVQEVNYTSCSVDEVKQLLDEDAELLITLVDVRRVDEYEESHIPGAINIPNEEIAAEKPEGLDNLESTIILYCRTGVRSVESAEKLCAIGYSGIINMEGGITDWSYDTVSGSEPGEYMRLVAEEQSGSEGEANADAGVCGTAKKAQQKAAAQEKAAVQAATATTSERSEKKRDGILSSFSATDLNGNSVSQSLFSNYSLTMVNVWDTYCGPCINEMPDLGQISVDYADKGVRVVGILCDATDYNWNPDEEQVSVAKDIASQTGAKYTHIVPSSDLSGFMSNISVVPTTYFVNCYGEQVGKVYTGSRSNAKWREIIDTLLTEV